MAGKCFVTDQAVALGLKMEKKKYIGGISRKTKVEIMFLFSMKLIFILEVLIKWSDLIISCLFQQHQVFQVPFLNHLNKQRFRS